MMHYDYSFCLSIQVEEFALRSLNEEHPQMSLLSPLTAHLNLPPAEETLETTVMGQMNFFFPHMQECKEGTL